MYVCMYAFNAQNSKPVSLHCSNTPTMAKPASFCPFFLSLLIICCSGFLLSYSYYIYALSSSRHGMMNIIHNRRTLGDTTIITVPSSKPEGVNPNPAAATPVTVPSTTIAPPYSPAPPVAYPPPSPSSSSSPPSVPITNPQAQPPPSNSNNAAPSSSGQKWCVAKSGVSETALQSALDYACGQGGSDCSQIQQGGRCYNPNTLQNHASFAFNSYYQKNPAPTSCDFGGAATLVTTNPSSGSCIYSSSGGSSTPTPSSPTTTTPPSSSASPTPPSTSASPTPPSTSASPTPPSTSTSPTTPSTSASPTPPTSTSSTPTSSPTSTPTTPKSSGAGVFGFGSPPSVLNSSSPVSGNTPVFPSPPTGATTSWSDSDALRPYVGSALLLISLVTAKLCIRL